MRIKALQPKVQFRSPEYDEAWTSVLDKSVRGLVLSDPVIGMMGHVTTEHAGPSRNVRTPVVVDTPMCEAQFGAKMGFDDIRATSVEAQTMFVFQMFESMMETVGPTFIRRLVPSQKPQAC